jgi:hypothetical protein
MPEDNAAEFARASHARKQLAAMYRSNPDVSLVDIGLDSLEQGFDPQIVLRLHLRQAFDPDEFAAPAEIDGFPVRIIYSDYHLE